MAERNGRFPDYVRTLAKELANYRCERCGRSEDRVEQLEVHHKLAIWFASKYFPHLSGLILNSVANAEVLCHRCHFKHHRRDRTSSQKNYYRAVGRELMEKQRRELGSI